MHCVPTVRMWRYEQPHWSACECAIKKKAHLQGKYKFLFIPAGHSLDVQVRRLKRTTKQSWLSKSSRVESTQRRKPARRKEGLEDLLQNSWLQIFTMLGPAFNSSRPRASFQAGRIKSACFSACTSTKEGGFFQLSFCFQVLFEYRAPGCFTWETHPYNRIRVFFIRGFSYWHTLSPSPSS